MKKVLTVFALMIGLLSVCFGVSSIYSAQAEEPATCSVKFYDDEKELYALTVETGNAPYLGDYPDLTIAVKKDGYTFKGWALSKGGNVIAKFGYFMNVANDLTLYAVYEEGETTYTVTIKEGEKVLATVPAAFADKLSDIGLFDKVEKRTGYKLTGFSDTENGEKLSLDKILVTEDKTVYTVFDEVKYTVKFVDGENIIKAVTVKEGEKLENVLDGVNLDKDGYTFKGWKKNGEIADINDLTVTEDLTLSAEYEIKNYTVSFFIGDALIKSVTVPHGSKFGDIDLTEIKTDKDGYTFKGWAFGSGEIIDGETIIKEDVKLTAFYEVIETPPEPVPEKVKLTFSVDGVIVKIVEVEKGSLASSVDLGGVETAKDGYTFKGWATAAGGAIMSLNVISVNEDLTLYAVYEKVKTPEEIIDNSGLSQEDKDLIKSLIEKVKGYTEDSDSVFVRVYVPIICASALVFIFGLLLLLPFLKQFFKAKTVKGMLENAKEKISDLQKQVEELKASTDTVAMKNAIIDYIKSEFVNLLALVKDGLEAQGLTVEEINEKLSALIAGAANAWHGSPEAVDKLTGISTKTQMAQLKKENDKLTAFIYAKYGEEAKNVLDNM